MIRNETVRSSITGGPQHWSRGGLQLLVCCPACGDVGKPAATMVRGDDSSLMPDQWYIHRCAKCSSIYLNPRPDAASLPLVYADYKTHNVGEKEQVFTSNTTRWALVRGYLQWRFGFRTDLRVVSGGRWLFTLIEPWRLKLDWFGRHLSRDRFPVPGRMLDVGCGAGDYITRAQAMGWSAAGCDPDRKVVDICQSHGLDVRYGGVEEFAERSNYFDVITLDQVIEHVPEPTALLRRCIELLRRGGMVWVGCPNANAIGLKIFASAWSGLHPPYHLCVPTQRILREWLAGAGFERIEFLRRGAHARTDWRAGLEIADHLKIRAPSQFVSRIGRMFTDVTSTFSPKWGEKTIAIAWKPLRR